MTAWQGINKTPYMLYVLFSKKKKFLNAGNTCVCFHCPAWYCTRMYDCKRCSSHTQQLGQTWASRKLLQYGKRVNPFDSAICCYHEKRIYCRPPGLIWCNRTARALLRRWADKTMIKSYLFLFSITNLCVQKQI